MDAIVDVDAPVIVAASVNAIVDVSVPVDGGFKSTERPRMIDHLDGIVPVHASGHDHEGGHVHGDVHDMLMRLELVTLVRISGRPDSRLSMFFYFLAQEPTYPPPRPARYIV